MFKIWYRDFVWHLRTVCRGCQVERSLLFWDFMMNLFFHWIIGFCASVLGNIFDTHIYELCSLILGFSVFVVPLILAEEKKSFVKNYKNVLFTVIGIAVVVVITCLNPTGSGDGMDLSQLSSGKSFLYFWQE